MSAVITGRSGQLRRGIELIVLLAGRAYSIAEISERSGMSTKTTRRDIRALEDAGVPVYCTYNDDGDVGNGRRILWRVAPHWMKRFT